MRLEDKILVMKKLISLIHEAIDHIDKKQYPMLISDMIQLSGILKKYVQPHLDLNYIERRIKQLVQDYLEGRISEEELRRRILDFLEWAIEQLRNI